MIREAYAHTRNYGCRLRRFTWNGVDMLTLENSRIKVAVALGKGADIVEFVYKPTDTDCMWHSFNPLGGANHLATAAMPSGNFLDAYSGGWQDLFPTYSGSANFEGALVGVHGEACLYPWNCEIVRDEPECVEALLSLRMQRTPFRLEKTLRVTGDSSALDIHEVIINEGTVPQDFMWGQHPAFGVPFLDENVRIRLAGEPIVHIPESTIAHHTPFAKAMDGKWPLMPGKDGKPVDVSRACSPDEKRYIEYCVSDLAEGKYEVVNEKTKLGIRMTWDKSVCPYLWVWGLYHGIDQYPWFGRAYVLAVEPWSTFPADYNSAKEKGGLLHLEGGARMETDLRTELFIDE